VRCFFVVHESANQPGAGGSASRVEDEDDQTRRHPRLARHRMPFELERMKPKSHRSCWSRLTTRGVVVSLVVTVAVAASIFAAVLRGAEPKAQADWRALPLIADGKVSPDWVHVGWGGFVVDEGALRTECHARGLGLLVYKKEKLGNCRIRVVYKSKDARSNAGVYVRIADGILDTLGKPGAAFDRDAAGKISAESMEKMKASAEREEGPWYAVHNGYEVQIADGGDAWHRTGSIYSLAPSTFEAKKHGEWRTMIITLAGGKISVELDGVRVSGFDPNSPGLPERKQWHEPKREPKRPEPGYIGLQNHDPGDVVWFKEVSVRPIPAGEAK
jgi:Domain of Unknown Function (DUF1080)